MIGPEARHSSAASGTHIATFIAMQINISLRIRRASLLLIRSARIGRMTCPTMPGRKMITVNHWLAALYSPISSIPPGWLTKMALHVQFTGMTMMPVNIAGRLNR